MADDYTGVQSPEDDELRRFGPPVSPTSFGSQEFPAPQPTGSAMSGGLTPPVDAPMPAAHAPGVEPSYRTTGDRAPTPAEYIAPALPGWKRALGALSVGAAQFGGGDAAGTEAEKEVFERPKEEAARQFAGASEAYKTDQQVKEKQAEETRLTAAEKAEEPLKAAQANEVNVGSQLVTPGAPNTQIMRKNAGPPQTAIISGENQRQLADINNTAKANLQAGKPISMDQLAAQATKEGDNETLKKIEEYKRAIAAAGKQEPGNFVPVNDAQGNIMGWADPKSRDWVPASSIAHGAVTTAAGGESGSIPPKPNANIVASAQSAQGDIEYANLYLQSGKFTGPGDELLMERFFDLAKPSTGFRMSQPQINMLMGARSWMDSAEGLAYHAKTGQWFPPTQRQQIVDAMKMEAQAKGNVAPKTAGGNTPTRPKGVPDNAVWDNKTRTWSTP